MKKHRFHNLDRAKLLLGIIFSTFILISFRLFQIQILNFSRYKSLAREQHWDMHSLPARRGTVLTNDNYPVAFSAPYYYLYTQPLSSDSLKTLNEIKAMNLLSQEKIDEIRNEIAANPDKPFKIDYPFTWEEKETLNKLSTDKKLKFDLEYKRSYPEDRMLSHVLGFIGKNRMGEETGYYGLEQYYDGYLKGHDGIMVREKSASGDPLLFADGETTYARDGSSIYLTIDRNMQFILEKYLNEGVDHYNAKSGVGIIVDSLTGEIKAMASAPSFDPTFREESFDENIVRNTAISDLYEPGSVVKALTMSSAIDLGKVNLETTVNDSGTRFYSGYEVDNWDGKHHGVINMTQVLQLSNNIGIGWVGMQVGPDQLMKYLHDFGLGDKTGIDLEGEEKGIMYSQNDLKDIELINASFGQGISATPLQIVMSFAAVANKGKLMKPYVVSKIETDERVIENQPEIRARPISEKTSDIMIDMLTKTVSGGEAKYFISKKYNIAGKTGTAQVPIPGGYDAYRTNATFVGFFTSYPEFVMLVKLEEPTSPSGYAAETAVPLWMKVAEEVAVYKGLKPDKN
jgi:stage V sporulation protein D (sporulation-specific penicillin-binding protein)